VTGRHCGAVHAFADDQPVCIALPIHLSSDEETQMRQLTPCGLILVFLTIPLLTLGVILTPVEPTVGYPIAIAASAGFIGGCILLAGGGIASAIRASAT
jgi:hypothetical protein